MTPPQDPRADPDEPSPIIVAVSASGLDTRSLEHLLAHMPLPAEAAAIVVLQRREALDEDRLHRAAKAAGGAITQVVDGARIEGGHIYLPAADLILDVAGGAFRTRRAENPAGHRGTIDSLLVSLARDREGSVLAVALAGTDGEGTLGFKAVKEADGLTLAEETDEARDGELGRSDGPAAIADAVLPVAELAGRVLSCVRHLVRRSEVEPPDADAAEEATALAAVATTLRNRTGHDFHGYKRGTFLRRVQRRMQVVQADGFGAYVEVLRTRPDEVQQLFNDLLIGVTRFFRDGREFERLEREVIPGLFAGKGRDDQVRVWVIGCSTGEEAYSLAILLREHMAALDEVPQVQIFATDLDGRALASARVGRYADTVARDLGPERLARWFVREGNTYCVVKELRELCIFSQHSIVKDAPFSRLDLVSCRNLLIYLDQELQARIVPLFHFALRSNGVLFLGNSENVARHGQLFEPIDTHSRIFRRVETGSRILPDFPFTTGSALVVAPEPSERARPPEATLTRRAERFAERFAPAYVIVDAVYDVLHFSGRTGRYIDPAGGTASLNLLQLVHRDLRLDLRMALGRAASERRAVQLNGVRLGQNGQQIVVDVVVEPADDGVGMPRNFFVLFMDAAASSLPARPGRDSEQQAHLQRLEVELRTTQERLQATNEELESTNEELKASNEEYQALNEELQSMNEELQTSKEELQSVNEELTTLNGELGHRVRDLSRANSDLKNLIESTQIATLFLGNDLRVTNFTPAAQELFHLVESDVGRPIGHIKARVAYDELVEDARRVLRTLSAVDREVDDRTTGSRYMVRVLPYRSTDNFIAGVVVTFVDVTELRRGEERVRDREALYSALATATGFTVYRMSPDWGEMHRLDGNGFLSDMANPSQEWLARYIPENEQSRVLAAIREAIRSKGVFQLEHRVRRADGGLAWTLSRAVPLLDERDEVREWIGVASDITARKGDGLDG